MGIASLYMNFFMHAAKVLRMIVLVSFIVLLRELLVWIFALVYNVLLLPLISCITTCATVGSRSILGSRPRVRARVKLKNSSGSSTLSFKILTHIHCFISHSGN